MNPRFLLALPLLAGCDVTVADALMVGLAPLPAMVDPFCGDGCEDPEVLATITWPEDPAIALGSSVTIHQYRIDYDFPDVVGEVPFYANLVTADVNIGAFTTFLVTPIGQRQLAAVLAEQPIGATGTATIKFAGWDHLNNVVEFPTDGFAFALTVVNGPPETGTTGTTSTASN